MGELEIFDGCPEDIWWVYWRYLMVVLKEFHVFPGDFWYFSWRY